MLRTKNALRNPFASALLGGIVVGLLGWLAIAAGWIEADPDGGPEPTAAVVPATRPVSDGLTINEIYDRASPAIAHIEASGVEAAPAPAPPFGPPGGVPRTATGSGFLIDDGGHLITNAHVVAGSEEIRVTLGEDGEPADARLVGSDPSTDIAVLEIDAGDDAPEPLALGRSADADVGDPVLAIGNPFGLDRTATSGIVSAVQRQINAPNGFTIQEAIQTDAPINPGNSGGPLIDAAGEVIGVNSQIESSGGGNVGIGFAVPIDTAREVAEELIDDGEVEHAYLGISGADVTAEVADVLNLGSDGGAVVQEVVPGSPADEAGLEAGDATVSMGGERLRAGGDVIVAVDGERVDGMDDVIAAVDSHRPGEKLTLTVERSGEERAVAVELAERPARTP